MKKATALLTLALFSVITANAQDTKKVRLGIELAPNMGWLASTDKNFKSDGTRIGFRFGLLGDFQLGANANYFFSTGAFLNNVGGKYNYTVKVNDTLSVTSKGELKMQYVEIPLTIKLKTNEIGYMTYFGQIGFDAGLRVSAKAEADGSDAVDVADETNLLRLALVVGGGLEYNFSGNTSALVGLKYSNGFTNTYDSDGPNTKLHYFELTIGALF